MSSACKVNPESDRGDLLRRRTIWTMIAVAITSKDMIPQTTPIMIPSVPLVLLLECSGGEVVADDAVVPHGEGT